MKSTSMGNKTTLEGSDAPLNLKLRVNLGTLKLTVINNVDCKFTVRPIYKTEGTRLDEIVLYLDP